MYPCDYLSSFTLNQIVDLSIKGETWISFKNFIDSHESRYTFTSLDFFADFGGYLGLFLGFSVLQFRDCVIQIIRKIIS